MWELSSSLEVEGQRSALGPGMALKELGNRRNLGGGVSDQVGRWDAAPPVETASG